MPPRPLDHLVMPVTDIRTSRERLTTLGFTVAADARHPFGTENACVFFADKSYLEPLGIASEEECLATAKAGNQFTARNNAFRFRNGPEGLSAIVMGSEDADSDHAGFRAEGISGGDILQFSRVMKLPDGSEITPTFKLAFAADLRSPDFHGITCQRINVPPADRSALEKHANGVTGIKKVVLTESHPADFEAFLKAVVGQPAASGGRDGLTIATANAEIQLLNADGAHEFFGLQIPESRGLVGRSLVFQVEDLTATETFLAGNGVTFNKHNGMLLVPHQPGQGVPLAFAE
ncbi:MAG: lactoylglutathione lyase [Rhizobium sp.]|nr:lactoylglutathione lyase [Rhizobium sp.]